MTRLEALDYLIGKLNHNNNPVNGAENKWRLFRSMVNVRAAAPIDNEFLIIQNELLKELTLEKGITDIADLTPVKNNLYLWKGDITTLKVDAIVNAANSGMTGCYCPCHGCIDNAIHTFAGVQLRLECNEMMLKQGFPEPTGQAKITSAYNLTSRYVIHTVGPIVQGALTEKHKTQLANCYHSCLKLADENNLQSIAFCCISTGEFHFPNDEAAKIAMETVNAFISTTRSNIKVIFNVFTDFDRSIYEKLLF